MSKQLENHTFTTLKVYIPHKSSDSSSNSSEKEQSIKEDSKDDGEDSWIKYQKDNKGV